jgi:hypothetical protein
MLPTSPTPEKPTETISDAVIFSRIIAKNFLSIPKIAEDMSIIRRNIQNMVKMKGSKAIRKADAEFMSSSKAEEKLKAEQEAGTAKKVTPVKKEEEGTGLFGKTGKKMFDKFKSTKVGGKVVSIGEKLLKGFKAIFNPKNFMKLLGRLALPLLIFAALFKGVTSAFDMWKETGSIWEAFKAGVGGIVEFLTFGLIDKKMVSDFYDWGLGAIEKILKSVAEFFGFGDLFVEKFDKVKKFLGVGIQPKAVSVETETKEAPKQPEPAPQAPVQKQEQPKPAPSSAPTQTPVTTESGAKTNMVTEAPAAAPTAPAPMTAPTPKPSGPSAQAVAPSSLSSVVSVSSGVDMKFNSEFEKRLAAMAADFKEKTGKKLIVTSGYRSTEEQAKLYAKYGSPRAAKPGRSFHEKELAIDIAPTAGPKGTGSPMGFLNELAGTRTASTGWLEKFGLTRPVPNEDWHIQPTGLVGTGDAPIVANKTGEAVDASKGTKDTKLTAEASAPTSGSAVSQASNDVAVGQRQQSKPSAPIIVKNTTINNNNSTNTQLASEPKDNNSTNGALLARAT